MSALFSQTLKGIKSHYRWLWAIMWVLGIELRISGRAASALNCWVITLAAFDPFFKGSSVTHGIWNDTFKRQSLLHTVWKTMAFFIYILMEPLSKDCQSQKQAFPFRKSAKWKLWSAVPTAVPSTREHVTFLQLLFCWQGDTCISLALLHTYVWSETDNI